MRLLPRCVLYEESVRIVVGTHHPAAGEAGLTLPDLLAHPWILPGTETVLRRELEEFFVRAKLPLPENRIECTSFLTVRQLLVETDVVAVLPGLIGADDPRLTPLPITLDPIGHSVGITLPRNRPLSPSTRALLRKLRAAAAGLKPAGAGHAEGIEPVIQA
ncbi:LysR substrate-binding domain-containing protein [Streptomyces sp. NPDC053720]|uniref:LysR substrate-binding domain-containing protein n=1 Tax=Streptomyces sp. NPDC053720 TaxID=3154855 RepID=UPI003427DDB8